MQTLPFYSKVNSNLLIVCGTVFEDKLLIRFQRLFFHANLREANIFVNVLFRTDLTTAYKAAHGISTFDSLSFGK